VSPRLYPFWLNPGECGHLSPEGLPCLLPAVTPYRCQWHGEEMT
jgi:hypothetical protein